MNNILRLIKVHFINTFKLNGKKSKAGRSKANGLGTLAFGLILVAIIALYGYFYAKIFIQSLGASDNPIEVLPFMLAMCSVLAFAFSFYSVSGVLYGGKDFDTLFSMPIKKSEIIISKLLYTYVTDLAFSLIIMLATAFAYIYNVAVLSNAEIFKIAVMTVISPLFPMALSIVIGVLSSVISSFFVKRNLVQTIFFVLVLTGIFAISFSGDELELSAITKIYFIYPLARKAIFSFTEFWYFLAVSVGSFSLVYLFVSLTYSSVTTLVNSRKTKRNYKLKGVKTRSQFSALLAKETKKFFTTPLYVMNCLLGYVFSIGASVVVMIMFYGDNSELGFALGQVFSIFAPCVYALTMMMGPPTTSAVSLEGKSIWIVNTMPIKTNTLLKAKLALTYIMAGITAIISSVLLGIAFKLEIGLFALNVVIALGFAVFSANVGLSLDLIFAKFSWTKETQVIKQGAPVLFSILIGMALAGLLIVIPIKIEINRYLFFGAVALFLIVTSALTYAFIMKKGEKLIYKKV